MYYRIAGGVLRLPSLRARADRRALITQMIVDEMPDRPIAENLIAPAALQQMLAYAWPGNLRQMHAVIRYCCAVMNGERIELNDLPEELMESSASPSMQKESVLQAEQDIALASNFRRIASQADAADIPLHRSGGSLGEERRRVIDALNSSRWNISAASRQLGMCRASLYRKLRQLDIPHVRDQIMSAHLVSYAA